MALVKGKFVDKTIPIQSDFDPVDTKDLARKGYVDQKAADEAAAAEQAAKTYTDGQIGNLEGNPDVAGLVGSLANSIFGAKGQPNGFAELDESGKVPSAQLPGYVDDVEEYDDLASFPAEGMAGKLYVAKDSNKVYRWSGSLYIEISASPGSTDAVPEGSTNLYYTNARASAAAPVQSVAGKTGAVTLAKGDVGLSNVDNTSDMNKPVSTAMATALAGKQASLGTGTTSQYLRGDLTWAAIPKAAKVLTVGVDANTIAGCIALCTSPTATNNYVIEIPPGSYTEDLAIPGNVHLKGLANPNDSLSVKITGQHTIQGTSNNALNNRVCLANIIFVSAHATTPLLAISGTLAETEVQMSGCFLQNSNTASTAKLISLGLFGKLYANNTRSRMAGSGNGGTHFTIAAGGALYTQYGLDVDGGSCVIDMTGQGYAQIVYGILACQGASAIKIAASGQVLMQSSSLTNNAAVGNGINLLGANANCFASHCVFNILDNAASFVVTGVAGSFFGMFANSYSHIPGLVVRNTKIGTNVTQLRYSGSLAASDIGDFQSAARTAAVGDAIVDGVTTVAPSQNAVFDALALKLSTTLKGAINGLAELDGSGKVPLSQIPASVGAVQSVNTKTGAVVLQTDDIAEAVSPTNKWFTDARAKAAAVGDAIADGVTDKAPSQNAVYDALALKLDQASKGAAGGVAELDGSGKVPSIQLPSYVDDVIEVTNYAALPGAGETGKIYVTLDYNKCYRWSGSIYIEISASPGSTDALAEGSVNKYYTDARAKTAAIVNSTAGSQTDQAASVSAMKTYLSGQVANKVSKSGDTMTGKLTLNAGADITDRVEFKDIADGTVITIEPSLASMEWSMPSMLPGLVSVIQPGQMVTSQMNEAGDASLAQTNIEPGIISLYGEGTTPSVPTEDQHAVNKKYVDDQIAAIPLPTMPTGKKERFVLTSGDIANGYVDCAFEAMAETMLVMTGGVVHNEGAGDDYVLSLEGGVTRISFEPDLTAILAVGDDIYVQYMKM